MSKGKMKVRGNGDVVRPYVDNGRDEVAQALAEMEAERKVDADLDRLMMEGDDPADACEEWPGDDELEQA